MKDKIKEKISAILKYLKNALANLSKYFNLMKEKWINLSLSFLLLFVIKTYDTMKCMN